MKQWLRRIDLKDVAPLITLVLILCFFSLCTKGFLRPGTFVQILKQGSVLGIVSVGLTFVLISAEIDLAVGVAATWAASLCAVLYRELEPQSVGPVVLFLIVVPL